MLQNDAIRNLYQDTGADTSQQTPKESNVLDVPVNVTFQPGAQRLPLPVTRVESNIGITTYVPMTGYDFLKDLPSVHIEQTFEFNDSLTAICPENRFIVRSPLGEALYAVTESSSQTNFLMCGCWRPFQLHVIDKTYQEALLLRKSFALSSLCCLSKQFEVWVPPGHLLGRVVQSPISLKPRYFIEDGSTGALMFYIEGPRFMACRSGCYSTKETYFRVHSGDVLRASIDHKWSTLKSQYTLNIYFSDSKLTAKEKALILGSAFLLEYQYFHNRF
ncbi:phospholipid scramblase 1 [Glossina fuscipes]|uniref:Phospholipid scramblase n=1 Tax=Glossina fuscipes TaxID=7396 RepID=A0A9C5Z9Z3_9MUSC|nr:phospholipid scramblase 1 [Glossina fuscipes]XP_037895723.1 phospholipid scramblase 1 [Glossina fuscipes]